jgi:light-regulated signal transduction histidine kinase (bacteriophytochrome)
MKFLIVSNNGVFVLSNIDNETVKRDLQKCSVEYEKVNCEIYTTRRQGRIALNGHLLYVTIFDNSITNKIFKHYLSGIKIIGELIDFNLYNIKDSESKKTRRLKHNLINHNSNILQELYRLIPQDAFKGGSNHVDVIQNLISSNSRKAAFTYLKVLKSSNLMKAEFEVYEMFNTDTPYLDFIDHQIHKVVILTLNPFWLDLVENKVNINIQPFYEKVNIDYKSISVALSHIFDNASKYLMPHSELNLSFIGENEQIIIQFDMTSLKVEQDEVPNIFTEANSGKWAKEMELEGDGVGMFVIKKLIELNKGTIEFVANYDNNSSILLNGIPYEKNRIKISLNKSA